ncbi:MAG: hypothetical protein ACLPX5_00120 [Dissulfurispiraceae bacterium]
MRYLIALLLMLLPALVFAEQKAEPKEVYLIKCEAVKGGQCKMECAKTDRKVEHVTIMEGEEKGAFADLDCTESGKDMKCCVDKAELKK